MFFNMDPVNTSLVCSMIVAAIAAVTDIWKGVIPNRLTLAVLIVAPLGHGAIHYANGGVRNAAFAALASLSGAVLCGIAPYVLYRFSIMGGGDVKLFAAIGAICRPVIGIEIVFYACIVGAFVLLARLAYEGRLFQALAGVPRLARNSMLPEPQKHPVPAELFSPLCLAPPTLGGVVVVALLHWRLG